MTDLLTKISSVFSSEQTAVVDRAYHFAEEFHSGQKRDSGEPYFTHPVEVANILLDMGLDFSAVSAALLHDVVEDTAATEQQVIDKFGREIAELVSGVTKLDKIYFKSKEEEQAENFRKMFFAMSKDIRILLIKLADRLHNMRTIGALSEERRFAMANETIEIYAPLASRLGLSYLKCELEDLSLQVLHPAVYESLLKETAIKRAERQDLVAQLCLKLKNLLAELNINGEVSGRHKHIFSIYNKMLKQNKTFEQIYDLTAVRVIVNDVRECYEVLGVIHTMWKPIPGRFKDYIAVPKTNGYQSLHTTVMTNYGMPFEIQIRTHTMHKVAEYGIAAHWKYKENRSGTTDLDAKLSWLRDVFDVQGEIPNSREFLDSFKIDLYGNQVFVFTPKGDVVVLPEGSTPVDFAYHVHSEVGNKCIGAKINTKIVPLETKLKTGDYIEIITTSNSKGPSRDWLRFCKTTAAKGKIRLFFKKEMKTDNIKRGKEMLELEAKHRGYNFSDLLNQKWLDIIMQRYSISSLDDMYAAVGYGGFTVNQILLKLIDFYKKQENIKNIPQKQASSRRSKDSHGVLVGGDPDILVRIAKCCNPVPGDDIRGFVSRGRGVAIHRSDCPNLKEVEQERYIDCAWSEQNTSEFVVSLQIVAIDSPGLLVKVSTIISEMKLSIESINARVDKQKRAVLNLGVFIKETAVIDILIRKLKSVEAVENVFRLTTKQ